MYGAVLWPVIDDESNREIIALDDYVLLAELFILVMRGRFSR